MLMGNNHVYPVSQSGTAYSNDLLQGQRGFITAKKSYDTSTKRDSSNALGLFTK